MRTLQCNHFVDCQLTKIHMEVNISIMKQNKSTLLVLGEGILGNEIMIWTIGKCKFPILHNAGIKTCLFKPSDFTLQQYSFPT